MKTEEQIAELLKPRYKVIARWPGMVFKVGEILSKQIFGHTLTNDYIDNGWCDEYPHLFKPLAWYAERKPEEMPEYVKETEAIEDDHISWVYKAGKDFDHVYSLGIILKMENDKRKINYQYLTPATESEYNQYINSKL